MALQRLFFTGKDCKYERIKPTSTSDLDGKDNTEFELNELSKSSSENDEENGSSTIIEEDKLSIKRRKQNYTSVDLDEVGTHEIVNSVETYEIDVDGADGPQNLQSIALKYNCSVWELKRVNNLVNSEDFHALRCIKVVAMKNSCRAELLQRHGRLLDAPPMDPFAHSNNQASTSVVSPDASRLSGSDEETHSENAKIRHVSIRQTMSLDSGTGDSFLRSMDADLHRIRESVINHKSSLSEVTSSLTEPRIIPFSHFVRGKPWQMTDVYCGMTGKLLFAISFGILIGLPVIGLGIYLYVNYITHSPG